MMTSDQKRQAGKIGRYYTVNKEKLREALLAFDVATASLREAVGLPTATEQEAERKRLAERPRREVESFAKNMEDKLKENDYKGGWKDCPTDYLIEKLIEEITELIACFINPTPDEIANYADQFRIYLAGASDDSCDATSEAADVGNIAMMLADSERKAVLESSAKGLESSSEKRVEGGTE